MDFSTASNVADLRASYDDATNKLDVVQMANVISNLINKAIKEKNLNDLLKIYDNKSLFALAAVHLTGRTLRNFQNWLTLTLVSERDPVLRQAVSAYLPNISFS